MIFVFYWGEGRSVGVKEGMSVDNSPARDTLPKFLALEGQAPYFL